jgi:antitoxin (DNA-binding transcriptional repressor) of toxin-antitoxin stability system
MKATVVQLRYKMKDVLRALERNESVEVLHRGEVKGTIVPVKRKKQYIPKDHPTFGMWADDSRSVEEIMEELRKPRYDDI